jgi:hypothetical protein
MLEPRGSRVVASMASCRHQTNRICAARLMSALTPAAAQIGRLRVSACYKLGDP